MPRRIDIELTSALSDGSWTWRKAGALKPKGTVDASIIPDGSQVGDELRVEAEQMLDGMEILSVVKGREKSDRTDLLEFIPDDKPFEAVIETRAKRGRGEGGGRGRESGDRDGRGKGRGRDGDRDGRGKGRDGDRPRSRDADRSKGRDTDRDKGRGDRSDRPKKPHFEAPPEVPQRPKPKRLRPGKARRQEVLAAVPEEQRPIAELALQGMSAVRTRVKEENAKLKADGKPEMPESSITKMAEEMLPKLRVADWLDRAEAAQRQMQHLDLRDLRSVVAASADSIVARDESTRAIAEELKASLATKQTEEMANWLEDVDAALTVGRVIRALRLSSQPPKAGVMFPPALAKRLGEAATASLLPEDAGDRWSAVLEAAAFSPVRALVTPTVPPTAITDDLKKTALRLGPLLPQIAALLGVEVPKDAKRPKPLRPTSRKDQKKARDDKRDGDRSGGRNDRSGSGGRDDRGGRDNRDSRGGRDSRDGRGGSRPPKDRPKGQRDIATVMKAKEEAAKAAEAEAEAAAAAAAEAEAAKAADAETADSGDQDAPADTAGDADTGEAAAPTADTAGDAESGETDAESSDTDSGDSTSSDDAPVDTAAAAEPEPEAAAESAADDSVS